jgi:hypothetical protein
MKRKPEEVKAEMLGIVYEAAMKGRLRWVSAAEKNHYLSQIGKMVVHVSKAERNGAPLLLVVNDRSEEVFRTQTVNITQKIYDVAHNEASGETDRLEEMLVELKANIGGKS